VCERSGEGCSQEEALDPKTKQAVDAGVQRTATAGAGDLHLLPDAVYDDEPEPYVLFQFMLCEVKQYPCAQAKSQAEDYAGLSELRRTNAPKAVLLSRMCPKAR
jgi:hypothetical protein